VEDDVDVWRYAIVSCMPETTTTTSVSKLTNNIPCRFLVYRRSSTFSFYINRVSWVMTSRHCWVWPCRRPRSTPWLMFPDTNELRTCTSRLDWFDGTMRTASIIRSTSAGLAGGSYRLRAGQRLSGWTVRWRLFAMGTWTEMVTVTTGT